MRDHHLLEVRVESVGLECGEAPADGLVQGLAAGESRSDAIGEKGDALEREAGAPGLLHELARAALELRRGAEER